MWHASTGHVIFASRAGGALAAPFDLKTLTIRGGAVPVLDGVIAPSLVVSPSGAVLYNRARGKHTGDRLVWVGRDGLVEPADTAWTGGNTYGSTKSTTYREKRRSPEGVLTSFLGEINALPDPSRMP